MVLRDFFFQVRQTCYIAKDKGEGEQGLSLASLTQSFTSQFVLSFFTSEFDTYIHMFVFEFKRNLYQREPTFSHAIVTMIPLFLLS